MSNWLPGAGKLTSSSGHPVERSTACDCSTSSLSSLSLISPKAEVLGRRITILSVITEVSSPTISLTGTAGLSDICSRGMGFQCLMIREPADGDKLMRVNYMVYNYSEVSKI